MNIKLDHRPITRSVLFSENGCDFSIALGRLSYGSEHTLDVYITDIEGIGVTSHVLDGMGHPLEGGSRLIPAIDIGRALEMFVQFAHDLGPGRDS